MTDAPLVSVVLPTFNRAPVLARAMNSVLAQDYRNLELIVVDDGSTDETEAVVKACRDSRVRYARQANAGPGAARNAGLRLAAGEFVAFQDSDDEWLPTKLGKQMATFGGAGPDLGLVACGHSNRGGPPDRYREWVTDEWIQRGDIAGSLLTGLYFPTPTWVLRKSALERAGGFDESLPSCEDWDLAFRLSDLCRIHCIPEVLLIKHHSPGSVFEAAPRRVAGVERVLRAQGHRWRASRYWRAYHEYRLGCWLAVDLRQWARAWRHLAAALLLHPASQSRPVARVVRAAVRARAVSLCRRLGLAH